MMFRTLALGCLLGFAGLSHAHISTSAESDSLATRADRSADRITDAAKFLSEVENSVEMARNGDYGRLPGGSVKRLEAAQATIIDLLEGHASARELPPAERIALYNAQELITATLRNNDKNRTICKREPTTGSRLTKTECLTVAQREARAKASSEAAARAQRNMIHPNSGGG